VIVLDEKAGTDTVWTWKLPSNEGIHSAMDPDSTVDKHVAGFTQHDWFHLHIRCS